MNTFSIGVALAVMGLGGGLYLVCSPAPLKDKVAELSRLAFVVGLFYVLSVVANHVWHLS